MCDFGKSERKTILDSRRGRAISGSRGESVISEDRSESAIPEKTKPRGILGSRSGCAPDKFLGSPSERVNLGLRLKGAAV